MSDLGTRIEEQRQKYGDDLLILGHHYQRSSVIRHADARGDSLELARKAAASKAKRIVFCGVHFMAESADILSTDTQSVYLPDCHAGCPMADMADAEQMRDAWQQLDAVTHGWLPVVYVNSTAEIKAECGRLGGSACTSSNARRVFEWAFAQGQRILFLPDEHLGTNTALDMGIPPDEIAIYDPSLPNGGLTESQISRARVIVWKGFCLVHQAFSLDQVAAVRRDLPDARIIIHPEAPAEVVAACDAHGSTAEIIDYVERAEAGSTIVVGTELNLVERLADAHRDRLTVKTLRGSVCANMSKITESALLATLESWPELNRIEVPASITADAMLSLERMLAI